MIFKKKILYINSLNKVNYVFFLLHLLYTYIVAQVFSKYVNNMLQIKMLLFSCSVLICARISRLEISVSYFHCIYTSQTRLHLKTYVIVPIWFLRKYFHDFGFDVGRPISTLPPKCIALFWKTLDLQNMHQFLPTSEPIRLHQNTNSSYCCLYMYKFNCDSTPFPSRVTFTL